MADAEMQRRKAAHREPDDMRFPLANMVEHGEDIVGRACLRIGGDAFRHVRRRKAPRVIRNGAIALAEMPHLRLVATQVAREFVHEDHRMARSGFLEIEADAVIRLCIWHGDLPASCRSYRKIL